MKILNHDEIQIFDWINSFILNIDWLISTDSLTPTDLMIRMVNQILLVGKHRVRIWLLKAQTSQIL